MIACRQGYKTLSEASKKFESLVLQRKVAHGGHPLLRWMAENVSVVTDPAGNIKPNKDTQTGRIDGIVALIMATWRAMLESGETTSPWETWGDDPATPAAVPPTASSTPAPPRRKTSPWETWGDESTT